jgi:protein HIRA/HIR1
MSMKSVDKNNANNDSSQGLLATMCDHFGSVNCVRCAGHGFFKISVSQGLCVRICACVCV